MLAGIVARRARSSNSPARRVILLYLRMTRSRRRPRPHPSLLPVLALTLACLAPAAASASTLPDGFQETVVFSGLTEPTAVRFAPDGRVFVAEKSGIVKVFDGLERPDADDLRRPAHQRAQLLGPRPARPGARIPNFPTTPYVYVLYTLDAAIGGTPPRWGRSAAPATAARPRPARRPTAASSPAGSRACRRPATR